MTNRPSRLAALVAAAFATALAAACSSSSTPSSPKGPSSAALAAYYDQLATTLLDSGGADTLVAQGITAFNGVIADGMLPSRVSVTVNGSTTALWYTNAATFVDLDQTDSMQFVMLWSDTLASTIVIAQYEDNVLENVTVVARGGGDLAAAATDSGSSVFGLIDRTCSLTAITNVNAAIPTFADTTVVTCQPGSGHYDFVATFPTGDATPTGAVQSITAGLTTTLAVRLQGILETAPIPFQRVPRHRL
jgi:hypothetical protein